MSDMEMEAPKNPFEGVSLYQMMFLNLRDGGGTPTGRCEAVAEFYGVTVDELKANCVRHGDELISERGHLLVYEKSVYEWAKG